jgi:hypothetical protein
MGNGHELVQGWPADDSVEGETDLHNVKDDALRAVVHWCPEHHCDGDANAWDDRARAHTQK